MFCKLCQLYLTISCILLQIHCICGQDYCYSTDESPYRSYSTKTKYTIAYNDSLAWDGIVEGCEPTAFYLLSRHGTRYTGWEEILYLNILLPRLKNHINEADTLLCQEDIDAINAWDMRMKVTDDKVLAEEGWQEMRDIASRYKEIYPSILGVPYNETRFEFIHTESEPNRNRTRDSARGFAEGLFGSYENVEMVELIESEDYLLSYYENCEKYLQEVADKPVVEQEKFKNGPEMASVMETLESRLALQPGNLSLFDLDHLYEVCRIEYGVFDDSPWCTLLPREGLEIVEYYEDIGYYWEDAYGHDINYEMTCELLSDMMRHMRLIDGETNTVPAATRFAHSGTLNTFFTRLGLHNDGYNLTSDGYLSNKDRQFRTSFHTPMASNIAFVYYECENPTEQDKVAVLVNEALVTLPIDGCQSGICDVDALSEEWAPIAESCDLEEICAVDLW